MPSGPATRATSGDRRYVGLGRIPSCDRQPRPPPTPGLHRVRRPSSHARTRRDGTSRRRPDRGGSRSTAPHARPLRCLVDRRARRLRGRGTHSAHMSPERRDGPVDGGLLDRGRGAPGAPSAPRDESRLRGHQPPRRTRVGRALIPMAVLWSRGPWTVAEASLFTARTGTHTIRPCGSRPSRR